jgi:DNA-binding XRE family transcriptional regulator
MNAFKDRQFSERELALFAKRCRSKSGISKAEAARQLGVNRATIQQAEENPDESLTRLRVRLIERYSEFKITGPVFILTPKRATESSS